MAVDGTSVFYVIAKSDIAAGAEITVDYGPSYFDDGPCPCNTCARSAPIYRATSMKNAEDVRNELKRKKREQRIKRKQKRRLRVAESADRAKESESG
jgi:hypothetical protein